MPELDELGAEPAARVERTVESGGDVGVELRGAEPRRDGDTNPGERAALLAPGSWRADEVSAERRSGPAIASEEQRQSASERAIGPAWSRLQASGTIPAIETRPRVGFIADVPQHAEGMRSDPAVSVPVAAGVIRAASAAAEPPLDPPGGAFEPPRAPDLVGRPARGELVGVEVAEKHHARGRKAPPDVAVLDGHVVGAACSRR